MSRGAMNDNNNEKDGDLRKLFVACDIELNLKEWQNLDHIETGRKIFKVRTLKSG
jgi:hypothetical protein